MAASSPSTARPIAPVILGLIIALIGGILTVGGAWLAALGGSLYYLLTGLAMIVAGILLIRRRVAGGLLYILIVVATLIWALVEVGTDNWALVPRVIAPLVLLIATFLVLPTL
jgi:quinoprotein glucose dehydrogenase